MWSALPFTFGITTIPLPSTGDDARRVADVLGFPHFTFDRRHVFEEVVISPFVEAYLAGETPSPCASCNRGVKLSELFALADRLGAEGVATGHYARILAFEGKPRLAMGRDRQKDQSYFLYATPSEWLGRMMFPLGDSTKSEVRDEAISRALPGAAKGESQELCFIGTGPHAYSEFVARRAGGRTRPGPIVDELGREIGHHGGVHRFTVGQRKGLGVVTGRPVFVKRIDPNTATVHVASEVSLGTWSAELTDTVVAEGIALPFHARVRVRYRHEGELASVIQGPGDRAVVHFEEPVRAVAPGQIAVFYEEDLVLGGGRIKHVFHDRDNGRMFPGSAWRDLR
jgi:tRNA-specific 2-thiouridylase